MTMSVIDTRPAYWQEWEQLGIAVVAKAASDYATARKRENKKQTGTDPGGDHFDPALEMDYYKQFFESGYFTRICPRYDGKLMWNLLENGGWKKIVRMYRYRP
jgi:hypothetical protein